MARSGAGVWDLNYFLLQLIKLESILPASSPENLKEYQDVVLFSSAEEENRLGNFLGMSMTAAWSPASTGIRYEWCFPKGEMKLGNIMVRDIM
jgi:hypothetical protein